MTTRWGRIGTTGQQKTKSFGDPAAAKKQMLKLIEEKTGEVGSTGTFMSRGLPGGDPILVGREEQKDDLQKALGSWLPWVVGGVVLFAIFSRR
jgi:hypothetical protein